MVRDQVLARLRAHEQELRGLGVRDLALFGSVARGDDNAESDIDLLVSLEPQAELSLLDVVGIERRLNELLGREVDLVERERLPAHLKGQVLEDAMSAF